jgi:hypothetical protein
LSAAQGHNVRRPKKIARLEDWSGPKYGKVRWNIAEEKPDLLVETRRDFSSFSQAEMLLLYIDPKS